MTQEKKPRKGEQGASSWSRTRLEPSPHSSALFRIQVLGPSCQKAINIFFDHFGSGVERKEGVLKSVLYNFQRYKLSSVVIEKILENIQRF